METMIMLISYLFLPIIPILLILFFDILNLKKAVILYFETEKLVRLRLVSIKDGMIKMGKRRFYVDKNNPPMIPHGTMIKPLRPLYVFKWDKSIALDLTTSGLKNDITPNNLTNLIENKTLEQLLIPKTTNKTALLFLIIGSIMGGLIGYVLAISF